MSIASFATVSERRVTAGEERIGSPHRLSGTYARHDGICKEHAALWRRVRLQRIAVDIVPTPQTVYYDGIHLLNHAASHQQGHQHDYEPCGHAHPSLSGFTSRSRKFLHIVVCQIYLGQNYKKTGRKVPY